MTNVMTECLYSSSCDILYSAASPAVDGSMIISLFGSSGVLMLAGFPFMVTTAPSPASPLTSLATPFTVKFIGVPRFGNSSSFENPA